MDNFEVVLNSVVMIGDEVDPGMNGVLLCCVVERRGDVDLRMGVLLCGVVETKGDVDLRMGVLLCCVDKTKGDVDLGMGVLLC